MSQKQVLQPVVSRLILKRFRSIPVADVALDNPTFLVGRNGSGKSNIVDAFSFLADAMALPLQAVFDKRGGISAVRNRSSGRSHPPNFGLAVVLGPMNGVAKGGRYAFEVKALSPQGYEIVREQCIVRDASGKRHWFERNKGDEGFRSSGELRPSLDPTALALLTVGGDSRFSPVLKALSNMRIYAIEPGKLRNMQDPDSGTSLRSDGSNAASVLQEISRRSPTDVDRMGEILESIVPNTQKVRAKKHGNKLSLEFTQAWGGEKGAAKTVSFDAFSMSDGTLRALGLLTAVYQSPKPSLLAIEEPEATIHPGALESILDLIRHASHGMQVVVTTHSPEVLDASWIRDENLRIVDWSEGATHISRVGDTARKALQDHLCGAGELLRSDALEPAPALFKNGADLKDGNLFEALEG